MNKEKDNERLHSLVSIIEALFDEETGCPFDREQTTRLMCKYILDEVYELIDAVQIEDKENIIEELGDVIFLVIMMLKVYSRDTKTYFYEAISAVIEKMKRRHPYVFGTEPIPQSHEEYVAIWERIKKEERSHKKKKSFSESIPQSAHPFTKAVQIQRKSKYIPQETTRPAHAIYHIIAGAHKENIDILDDIANYNQEIMAMLDKE